jgi:adenylosuccinate lyase
MEANMGRLKGLVFSQKVLLKLVEKGVSREEAYELVQRNAMKVWEWDEDFKTFLLADDVVMDLLTPREVEKCFDLKPYLKHVDIIFKRTLGSGPGGPGKRRRK